MLSLWTSLHGYCNSGLAALTCCTTRILQNKDLQALLLLSHLDILSALVTSPCTAEKLVILRLDRSSYVAASVPYCISAKHMFTHGRTVVHGWVIFNASSCCPALCEALAGPQQGPQQTAELVLNGSLESLQRSKAAQGRADPRQRLATATHFLSQYAKCFVQGATGMEHIMLPH